MQDVQVEEDRPLLSSQIAPKRLCVSIVGFVWQWPGIKFSYPTRLTLTQLFFTDTQLLFLKTTCVMEQAREPVPLESISFAGYFMPPSTQLELEIKLNILPLLLTPVTSECGITWKYYVKMTYNVSRWLGAFSTKTDEILKWNSWSLFHLWHWKQLALSTQSRIKILWCRSACNAM